MATIKTDVVTAIDAATPPIADLNEYMGEVKWIPVEYSTDGTLAADTLKFSKTLPAGTELIAIHLEHTAIASGELDIGYTGDPDAIIDGAVLTSAGEVIYPWNGAATAGAGAPVAVGGKEIVGTLTGTLSSDTINGYILVVTTGI